MKLRAFIFDIDGVLSNPEHRVKFAKERDWDKFHSLAKNDKPFKDVCRMCDILNFEFKIFFITGRTEQFRGITEDWIYRNIGMLPGNKRLFMRPNNTREPSRKIKLEIYRKQIQPNYEVLGVFEDQKDVVDMWRKIGLTCYALPSIY